eukprot:CAMPEP_0115113506 /NCGR_PEP_ID=MMETSP0227-20121206/41417_1 /TAXON_ID=89957 /ORGANISM="Polarella glacialis, Strain CCMP 1383" /LENGTH=134 /DNA_ID=CAMNT_0002513559 /DNA_START=39 /DNA_END=440 /DNA_ORIENTATION=+
MTLFLMRKWDELQKDGLPKWFKLKQALVESAAKLKDIDLVQLRPVEECLTDMAGFTAGVSHLRTELIGVSPASAITIIVVGLKAIRVLNNLVDVALKEILSRQTWIARVLLMYSTVSGWGATYLYWGTITQHLE